MRIQEKYLVPGLGGIVIIAAIGFAAGGASAWVWVILGLLGIGTIATSYAPPGAQVEVRAAIAIVGLVWLFIVYASLPFWLAFVGLGAIGALQIRHANSLRGAPRHTVDWINSLTGRSSAGDAGEAGEDVNAATAEETGAEGASSDSADNVAASPSAPNAFQKFARLNVAGIGSAALGAVALLCLLMPWVGVYAEFPDESVVVGYTLISIGDEGLDEDGMVETFFAVLLVIGALGVASVVVPRLATVFVAVAGIAVTIFSYIALYAAFGGTQSVPGASAALIPNVGWVLAILCYGLIFLLQLIPPWNRRKT